MLKNIEGIGWIVAVVQDVFLGFLDIAFVVTLEVGTGSEYQMNVINFKFKGASPEIQYAERDAHIRNETSFHWNWNAERIDQSVCHILTDMKIW